jgi:MFS transporter, DHA1 family, multidrug resistance protein
MITLAAYLLGLGQSETYGREILRARARRNNRKLKLPDAQSGVTLAQMARITIVTPLRMLVTEPIVIMCTIYLGLNFAVVFQWFVSVPVVLNLVYDFSVRRAGLAFIGAIGGALLSSFTSIVLEHFALFAKCKHGETLPIEARLYPAMLGSFLTSGSLFWIGWTADPTISYFVPIAGTAVYVWGNMSVLTALISYLFDAYPPAGTLSALTTAACFRIICAAIVPIFILDMIVNLTGAWTYTTWGILSGVCIPIPFILYKWGPSLREKSRYGHGMTVVEMEVMDKRMGMPSAEGDMDERHGTSSSDGAVKTMV